MSDLSSSKGESPEPSAPTQQVDAASTTPATVPELLATASNMTAAEIEGQGV
jgi:hypothetical protein